ncbi:hypothetical protein B0A48_01692 [Cryoendolithus antarcticus]|uniref:Phosphoesterase HXTX domain-containing protein n=1 Tax=Cryoendolithus antarcticus TaxID=1507870 RepID=A0A1V8TQ76_9PEZI|nr:hypothetical protein B0A48_01692 [Cryoendolithus antarcticus]
MASGAAKSWASITSQNLPRQDANTSAKQTPIPAYPTIAEVSAPPRIKRSPSPSHVPRTQSKDENVYILTLATDVRHHKAMTALRNQYFPTKLNKLAAHLTLFHALPGSLLESNIIPHIETVAAQTKQFDVHAAKPFRMKHGFAISVPKAEGGAAAQAVHAELQQKWADDGFLSEQDRGGCRVHYTIMNKVDEEADVAKAFEEVSDEWKGDWGTVEGLSLWRYERGWWKLQRKFEFAKKADGHNAT